MKKSFAALLTCVLVSGAASAQVVVDGSAEAGQAKSVPCTACHGPDGNSVMPNWPSIAGQHPSYIVQQMQAFRACAEDNPAENCGGRTDPLMAGQVLALSDQDMRNLAVYYAGQEAASKTVASPDTVERGERLYRGGNTENNTPACIACHGPTGLGNPAADYPSLAGQYAVYTEKQLRDYASGARRTDGPTRVMRDIAAKLSDEDIVAVSSYVQGLQ